VSVLMTCHDAAATIEESVRSVIAQTFTDWELVLVDNRSTDDSIAIVERLRDPRVRIERLGHNIGRTAALNHGLGLCRGAYVAVLDADDVSEPSRLARQVVILDRMPHVAVVPTGYLDIDGAGGVLRSVSLTLAPRDLRSRLASNCPIVHSSVMMHRAMVQAVGGYPSRFPYAQDFALWIALARTHEFHAVPEPLVRIRRTSTTLTSRFGGSGVLARDAVRLYARAQTLPGLRPSDRVRGLRTIAWYATLLVWRTLRRR
jgi:glycosyltransferase involved in cell wall biosynthesis